MQKAPKVRWREEHHILKRKIMQGIWSVPELEWLLKHSNGWPPVLEQMAMEKLRQAKEPQTVLF